MKPTVGRIVHYTNLGDKEDRYPPEQQAAIITNVHPTQPGEIPLVDLKVFYRTGIFDMPKVPFSETDARGHWSWPKKEGETK